ncbi:MAG: efflux RND transporter permease subunit, partial [Coprobacter sp.]|nr:efflux RND transporter permease subunit [Coprobacter sp.]
QSDNPRYDGLYLSNYATLNLVDELSRLPGVGAVSVFGAGNYSMRIWLDPEIMRIRQLTPADVYAAVQSQNMEVSAGAVGQPPLDGTVDFQYTLTAQGRLITPEEFGDIVIRTLPDGGCLRLKDLGTIDLGSVSYGVTSTLKGHSSAALAIYQLPGSNSLDVAKAVKAKMNELSRYLPAGVEYSVVLDTTEFVSASIHEVLVTLLEATLLVMIVILLFLQNFRAMIIPSLTIPVSLICTFAVLRLFGFSINTLTLFGLVLAIAIVVDDAIVVVENSTRLIDTGQYDRKTAVTVAMEEITGPVIGVVLVLLAVFIPTAFIGGITGQLYKQFALTIATATFFSGFNSLTLTPALCALFLQPTRERKAGVYRIFNKGYNALLQAYLRVVTRLLARPVMTMILFLLVSVVTGWLFVKWPTSFIPQEDQGYFIAAVQLPDAAGVERTRQVTRRIGAILDSYPEVKTYLCIDGFSMMQGTDASNSATFFVILKNWNERKAKDQSVFAVVNRLNADAAVLQEATVFAVNPPAISGLGVSGGLQFELEDRSNLGATELQNAVQALLERVREEPSLKMLSSQYQGNTPQYFLDIDRDKVQLMGLELKDVFTTLAYYMGTAYINDFTEFGRVYQVKLGAEARSRAVKDDVLRLSVRNRDGRMVPFSAFTRIEEQQGLDQVSRYDMYTAAAITAIPADGYSTRQAIAGMEQLTQNVLGNNFGYSWTSEAYQETQASSSVTTIFGLAILIVILVLAAQYESWSSPFAVILSLPFALLGVVLGCWIMGLSISIYSQIGIVLLIALSAKNAILIVEFAIDYHKSGESITQASIEAGRVRLRPILMTSFAFILGVMPLMFATGAGAESRISLGTAVVFGMTFNTLLGTLFVPNFYHLMQSLQERLTRKKSSVPPNSGKIAGV